MLSMVVDAHKEEYGKPDWKQLGFCFVAVLNRDGHKEKESGELKRNYIFIEEVFEFFVGQHLIYQFEYSLLVIVIKLLYQSHLFPSCRHA